MITEFSLSFLCETQRKFGKMSLFLSILLKSKGRKVVWIQCSKRSAEEIKSYRNDMMVSKLWFFLTIPSISVRTTRKSALRSSLEWFVLVHKAWSKQNVHHNQQVFIYYFCVLYLQLAILGLYFRIYDFWEYMVLSALLIEYLLVFFSKQKHCFKQFLYSWKCHNRITASHSYLKYKSVYFTV